LKIALDAVWTPAYYGDEEDFAADEEDINENWILFSKKNGQLLLKKGPHGKSYHITGQYEVTIGDNIYTGKLLSELIASVRGKEGGGGEAKQRNCASLIYSEDLRRFAGSNEIEPLEKKEDAKVIGKGEFGEVTRRTYRKEVNGKKVSMKVAVKRIKQKSRNALVGAMEVAVMSALLDDPTINKQHLLTLIGWYLGDKHLYVVTEFIPGGNLLDYLQSLNANAGQEKESKGEGEEEYHIQRLRFHSFVSQIASGMSALETKQIQHRDLAARNILLTQDHQIKVRYHHEFPVYLSGGKGRQIRVRSL
uniref:Protein kinase domain-containing protein n=1 Tax=Taenia asiatica TaxID=60517 RepID=A0A0R3VZ11_TAEAS